MALGRYIHLYREQRPQIAIQKERFFRLHRCSVASILNVKIGGSIERSLHVRFIESAAHADSP